MATFTELTKTIRIGKLLENTLTSKDTKEVLNELSYLANAYVLTIIKDQSDGRNIGAEEIKEIFNTLKKQQF